MKKPYARHRDNGSHTADGTWSYRFNPVTGSPTTSSGEYTAIVAVDTMDDVVTPGFQKLVAEGKIINNPMSKLVTRDIQGGGSSSSKMKSTSANWSWSNLDLTSRSLNAPYVAQFGSFENERLNLEALASIAMASALANIDKGERRMMEDLLEIRKTVALLQDPLSVCRDVHDKFLIQRKHWLKKGMDSAQAFSKAWLGTKYAYGSALYTAMGIHDEILSQDLLASRRNARLRSKGMSSDNTSADSSVVRTYTGEVSSRTFSTSFSEKAVARASVIYELKKYSPNNFSYRNGLRLKDVPRGIWNVLPFTWVGDRFLNISNTVSGVMNVWDPNVVILAGSVSVDHQVNSLVKVESIQLSPSCTWTYTSFSGDPMIHEYSRYHRWPWTPSIQDTLPKVSNYGISTPGNITDLLALLIGRFKTRNGR